MSDRSPEILIVGGGVIGLSIAWELAGRGRSVRLLERGELGREASWAGAGMLPAVDPHPRDPLEQLGALSQRLHPQWAARLREATGIDTGFRACGALYVARSRGDRASLRAWQRDSQLQGVSAQWLESDAVARLEPHLAAPHGACRLTQECQLRNPRHLQALVAACSAAGVMLHTGCEVQAIDPINGRVNTAGGMFSADRICVTAGPWTRQLLEQASWRPDIYPVRGQMLLYRCQQPLLGQIVNAGPRYLVPRDDGRLLAGSTEEEVGFDRSTTAAALAELAEFAISLVPQLASQQQETSWSGLRPAAFDGFPYLGRGPGARRLFVAAGHFRNGLFWSTATAHLMAQLLCDEPTDIDLAPFAVGR